MPTTTIADVRTIAIEVTDQDDAVRFFTETLGFEKRLDAPISATTRWVEVAPVGATTSLALQAVEGSRATGRHAGGDTGIRFSVPDASTAHATLDDRGVAVGELLRWDGIPAMFTFEDPDGNRFYVVEETR